MKFLLFALLFLSIGSCTKDKALIFDSETRTTAQGIVNNIDSSGIRAMPKNHPIYKELGYGYDVTGEYANNSAVRHPVINIDSFVANNLSRFDTINLNTQRYVEDYGENAVAYLQNLTRRFSGEFFVKKPLFSGTLALNFNNSLTNSSKFDGRFIYGSYSLNIVRQQMKINSDAMMLQNYLSTAFREDLNILTAEQLVRQYGTHFLVSIDRGAQLEIKFQSETTNFNRSEAARFGLKAGVEKVFNFDFNLADSQSMSRFNYNRKLNYRTRGGDPTKSLLGEVSLDKAPPTKISYTAWQSSVTSDNSVLIDLHKNSLIPIYDLIADPIKKAVLKTYIDNYLLERQAQIQHLLQPIYRYFNPHNGDHFYTRVAGDYNTWGYEGVAFSTYPYQTNHFSSVPIYRYWNGYDHFYTTDPGSPHGYVSEGIEFYAYNTQVSGTVPIHRYFNPNTGDHFYEKSRYNFHGYIYEGIAFYAHP